MQPLSNLATYQKGTYYFGIKILNSLPSNIKTLSHIVKQPRLALSDFLYVKSFYTPNEYFNSTKV